MVKSDRVRRRRKSKEPSKIGVYIITGLIIALMVASVAGVMLYAPRGAGQMDYGDLTFSLDERNGVYVTELDGQELRFHNLPYMVLNVPTDPEAVGMLHAASYAGITFDPRADDVELTFIDVTRLELALQLGQVFNAVTEPSPDYPGLPVMTCENASLQVPIIYLRGAPEARILAEDGCIILEGNQTSLLQAKDMLLYQYHMIFLPEDRVSIPLPEGYEEDAPFLPKSANESNTQVMIIDEENGDEETNEGAGATREAAADEAIGDAGEADDGASVDGTNETI